MNRKPIIVSPAPLLELIDGYRRPLCRVLGKILAVFLLVFLVMPGRAFSEEAYLSDIVVTNTRDNLLLYFKVNNCFTPDMNKAIESGIQTRFTFYIKLLEKRDLWFDKKIATLEITHSLRYDTLKKQYEVRRSEQANKIIRVTEFEKAKKLMAEVIALEIVPLHRLNKDGQYQIRMMAELDRIKLPLSLHHVFFFLSFWDFKTKWYVVDFRY